MKIKYNYEILAGAIFTIVAAILFLLIPTQIQTIEKSAINAKTIPSIALGGLFICSVLLFIQGFFKEKKEVVINKYLFKTESAKKEIRTCIFALILILYGIFFNILGYIIDTILLVSVILIYYHCKKWLYYAIAIVTVFIVYLVFTNVLNVNLPTLFL